MTRARVRIVLSAVVGWGIAVGAACTHEWERYDVDGGSAGGQSDACAGRTVRTSTANEGTCAAGESCDYSCTGLGCTLTCEADACCAVTCNDLCTVTCADQANCNVVCNDTLCSVDCQTSGTCTCTGNGCSVSEE